MIAIPAQMASVPQRKLVIHFRENLLFQFSVLSLAVMVALAVIVSSFLTDRLDRHMGLLNSYTSAVTAGKTISQADPYALTNLRKDVNNLRWITYGAVAGGFVILYGSLVTIVGGGWKTITRQRRRLESFTANLERQIQERTAELQEAQERLVRSERLAAIGELAAGVSHELRNPLGSINNAAYYIKERIQGSQLDQEDPKVSQLLEIMEEEITSSEQIIADLLDFARVNPPRLSPTNLETVVDSALSRIPVKESVEVVKDFEAGLPEVPIDGDQMRRAFANLIRNADGAMPNGGSLSFTARVTDGLVELEVRDAGQGITDADLPKIFEPLFTTKARGIGLGLTIVKDVIERHQGTIEASSQPGAGTTFTIRLPLGRG